MGLYDDEPVPKLLQKTSKFKKLCSNSLETKADSQKLFLMSISKVGREKSPREKSLCLSVSPLRGWGSRGAAELCSVCRRAEWARGHWGVGSPGRWAQGRVSRGGSRGLPPGGGVPPRSGSSAGGVGCGCKGAVPAGCQGGCGSRGSGGRGPGRGGGSACSRGGEEGVGWGEKGRPELQGRAPPGSGWGGRQGGADPSGPREGGGGRGGERGPDSAEEQYLPPGVEMGRNGPEHRPGSETPRPLPPSGRRAGRKSLTLTPPPSSSSSSSSSSSLAPSPILLLPPPPSSAPLRFPGHSPASRAPRESRPPPRAGGGAKNARTGGGGGGVGGGAGGHGRRRRAPAFSSRSLARGGADVGGGRHDVTPPLYKGPHCGVSLFPKQQRVLSSGMEFRKAERLCPLLLGICRTLRLTGCS
ncbi:uncharacterized protein LOC144457712 [Phascolarctos cinereus]